MLDVQAYTRDTLHCLLTIAGARYLGIEHLVEEMEEPSLSDYITVLSKVL